MSYSFRQRLQMALKAKELKERLGLTQEEVEFIEQNLMNICPHSDTVAQAYKESISSGKSIDQIIDEMTDSQFEDLCREVFALAKKNGVWLKKKLKKKQAEKAKKHLEEEKASDSDSDSDSDGDTEDVESQEAEVECSTNE